MEAHGQESDPGEEAEEGPVFRRRAPLEITAPTSPPTVSRSNLPQLVAKAAAAAGLTVGELGDALADGGFVDLPEDKDSITERYTLEDLGKKLHSEVQGTPRSKRARWYADLAETQRAAIVATLRGQGYPSDVIAETFHIAVSSVIRVYNKYADKLGAQVVGLRLNTIAGQMTIVKERAQQLAFDKGDPRALWSIEKDYVAKLQDLGIVDKAIHRIEHTHKFDDEQKAEIEAMVELERKKEKRLEEIKTIEVTVTDDFPEEFADE